MRIKKFLEMFVLFILNYKIINSNFNSNKFSINNNLFQLKNTTSIHNFQNKINTSFININSNIFNLRKISNKKNLFISAFSNYKWEVVEPFFNSIIRAELKNCDIVIFVCNIFESIKKKLKSHGIIVIDIPNQFENVSIINYRFKLYEDYLKDKLDIYNIVFTSDIRDTFFQRDVFDYIQNPKPYLGIAIEGANLTDNTLNRQWILDAFGEDVYDSIKQNRIICSGTVWGTVDKFYELSKVMWEVIMSKISIIDKIIDQAILNYIIYYKKIFNDSLMKSDYQSGAIMTLGFTNDDQIKFDSDNNLLNSKGEIASVIHQYDRKIQVVQKVKKKFCTGINYEIKFISLFYKNKNILKNFSDETIFLSEIFLLCIILSYKAIINKEKIFKFFKRKKSIIKNAVVEFLKIFNL